MYSTRNTNSTIRQLGQGYKHHIRAIRTRTENPSLQEIKIRAWNYKLKIFKKIPKLHISSGRPQTPNKWIIGTTKTWWHHKLNKINSLQNLENLRYNKKTKQREVERRHHRTTTQARCMEHIFKDFTVTRIHNHKIKECWSERT